MIDLNSQASRQKNSGKGDVKKAATKIVRCGEISRAARVLTNSGLAPATAETVLNLAEKKRPARVYEIQNTLPNDTEMSNCQSTTLSITQGCRVIAARGGYNYHTFKGRGTQKSLKFMVFFLLHIVLITD